MRFLGKEQSVPEGVPPLTEAKEESRDAARQLKGVVALWLLVALITSFGVRVGDLSAGPSDFNLAYVALAGRRQPADSMTSPTFSTLRKRLLLIVPCGFLLGAAKMLRLLYLLGKASRR